MSHNTHPLLEDDSFHPTDAIALDHYGETPRHSTSDPINIAPACLKKLIGKALD